METKSIHPEEETIKCANFMEAPFDPSDSDNIEIKRKLTDEQKKLCNHLYDEDYYVVLYLNERQDVSAEITRDTQDCLQMVFELEPFNLDTLRRYYNSFDIGKEVDRRREDEVYRRTTGILHSVRDIMQWDYQLYKDITSFEEKTGAGHKVSLHREHWEYSTNLYK